MDFTGKILTTNETAEFLINNSIKYGVVRLDDPKQIIYYLPNDMYTSLDSWCAQNKNTTSFGWLSECPSNYEGTSKWKVVERTVFDWEKERWHLTNF